MAGEYEKPITIERAIQGIARREYLLPAIQRKFEWDPDRVCALFDSIMRNYPINTFMFWQVESQEVRTRFKFYAFLERYCEFFFEDNQPFETRGGHPPFQAVIDGQQRMTSLYIGLRGTYATKLPRRHRPQNHDESIYPPKRLYLNLSEPLNPETNEGLLLYDFRFMTDAEHLTESAECFLYRVGDVLDMPAADGGADVHDLVADELRKHGQHGNDFARKTLHKLYFQLRRELLIHYYLEKDQDIDHVLDIFVRTNKGAIPLSFSDLLMSIAVANWQEDARDRIDKLVRDVWESGEMGFAINRDWVLKTALTVIDEDLRFKVANFSGRAVAAIEQVWLELKRSIVATFRLLKLAGLDDKALRAKNAAIPIVYYLFHKGRGNGRTGLHEQILNLHIHEEERDTIVRWLMMSILKGVFGGQSDTLLASLRKCIKENLQEKAFPLHAIVKAHEGTNKDLLIDHAFAERLIKTQKDDPMCYAILALLTPAKMCTTSFHKDHLHPAAAFRQEALVARPGLAADKNRLAFYSNAENWNAVPNLHLLDSRLNTSKQDKPLLEWVNERQVNKESLVIPVATGLDFEDFEAFISSRSVELVRRIQTIGRLN